MLTTEMDHSESTSTVALENIFLTTTAPTSEWGTTTASAGHGYHGNISPQVPFTLRPAIFPSEDASFARACLSSSQGYATHPTRGVGHPARAARAASGRHPCFLWMTGFQPSNIYQGQAYRSRFQSAEDDLEGAGEEDRQQ